MEIYRMPKGVESRWFTFENPTGAKGEGAKENQGAKGHAFDRLHPGQTRVLMDVKGAGTIHRIWFTFRERDPKMLRSLRLDMYWDGAPTPAVSVPFGDFFCAILGRTAVFENELFSNPEGRSFNCLLQMPFRKSAKVTITNENTVGIDKMYYDIDITTVPEHPDDVMYLHAGWHRVRYTKLKEDFELLPKISGRGRYLGAHVGLIEHPDNVGWWGEGEVKMYMDGDSEYPTIVGTGTEDYIGSGWEQATFFNRFQGCPVCDPVNRHYTFYRYHIPEPIYFQKDIRVTLQQIGGTEKAKLLVMLQKGVEIMPVSADYPNTYTNLLDPNPPIDITKFESPWDTWVNMYRRDDLSAVGFFYLDNPENGLPPLAQVNHRTCDLSDNLYA
ncbi:MAG: hypothetical protein AMXMBFR84_00850 [Candidatus Hydrogenedentota bacterium]